MLVCRRLDRLVWNALPQTEKEKYVTAGIEKILHAFKFPNMITVHVI